MRGFLIGLGVLLVLALGVGMWVKGVYNGLVTADEGVKTGWAQVENQLQRRFDLIPNLVRTVQGYAAHERETLQAVTDARARVGQARSVDEKIEANQELGSAISRLLLVVERYPDLKANVNFIRLQDELSGTENRISVERRRYNDLVQAYNIKVRSFPTSLFASMLGFERAKPFEADEGSDVAPKVEFPGAGTDG